MTRITRLEVITDTGGRDYVSWEEDNDITLSYQDDGRTLKVFVNTMKPKSPAEEAYYAVYGWYPPTTSSVSNYEDNRWRDFQNGYNASKVSETPQEPEELKTLYDALQCPLYINGYHFNEDQKDWICDIVEKWLPDELSCDNGVHNRVYELGWNDAIETIKDKLK